MPLTKITGGEFDNTQGGLIVAGIMTATSFSGNGASLTTLNASNISSGTLPDARFPATLPAVSGANLTGISGIPSGTLMLFQQTAAPTGWTKQTTHNDKALRVVTGAASSGGSTAFTSIFASRTPTGSVDNTTLTTAQIPTHNHSLSRLLPTSPSVISPYDGWAAGNRYTNATTGTSGDAGGGGAHNHGFTGTAMDFAVQYVDLIIASKD
jgi:hypothetical protein